MSTQKQFITLIAITASFTSFMVGYLLIQPRDRETSPSSQRVAILERFEGETIENRAITLNDGLVRLVPDATLAAANERSGDNIVYYHKDSGLVSRVNIEDQNIESISETMLPGLVDAIWSPDKRSVIALYSSPKGTLYKYFDYETKRNVVLGTDIVASAFSPDSKSAVFAKMSAGGTDIIVTHPDGSNPQTILKTRLSNISLEWPDDIVITTLDGQGSGSLYGLTLDGKLTKLLDSKQDLKTKWSPDGSLLYSTIEGGQTFLYWRNAGDREFVSPVHTRVDLCDWKIGGSIICLIDRGGAVSVVEITTANRSSKILASNLIISASRIFLSNSQDFLLVVSRSDHGLYALRLPK